MKNLKDTINKQIPALIEKIGYVVNPLLLNFIKETDQVVVLYFHGIYADGKQKAMNHVDPQNNVTISEFKGVIEYFLKHNYTFIKPEDMLAGLEKGRRYVMITFDDGYYNNSLIVDVIEEYKVPIVIFVSTNNVVNNQSYWWDIVYKYRTKQGVDIQAIKKEQSGLKKFKFQYIEDYIIENFGVEALTPWSDIDRPLTPAELKEMAKNELISLQNHTHNHAILTVYDADEIEHQLTESNKIMLEITGTAPFTTAFPNGGFNDVALDVTAKAGFKFAFTTVQKNNGLEVEEGLNCINRLIVINPDVEKYGSFYRLGYHPVELFASFKNKLKFTSR